MKISRREFLVKAGRVSIFSIGASIVLPLVALVGPVNPDQENLPSVGNFGIRYLQDYSVDNDEVINRIDILFPTVSSSRPNVYTAGEHYEQHHVAWHNPDKYREVSEKAAIEAICHIPRVPARIKSELEKLVSLGPIRSPWLIERVRMPDRGFKFV